MAKFSLKVGTTSKKLRVFIQDSSQTVIAGLSGLVYNSSGLTAYYIREGDATATAITLVDKTVGTYVSGGFKQIDATNMKGMYEFDPPNAALASGASVDIYLFGATNMAPTVLEIELTTIDNQDAVRGGMSALPNAAAAATGGLPTVDASNAVKLQSGTGANQISLAAGLVTVGTNGDKTGYTASSVTDKTGYALTTAEHTAISGTDVPSALNAQGLTTARAGYLDVLNGLVASIWAAATRTLTAIVDSAGVTTLLTRIPGTVQPQTGDAFARIGAPLGGSISADLQEHLGLLGANQGIRNAVYTSGNLTSYDLCTYDTSGHATTNDGATGLLHKYSTASTYDGSNNLLTSVTTKIS